MGSVRSRVVSSTNVQQSEKEKKKSNKKEKKTKSKLKELECLMTSNL